MIDDWLLLLPVEGNRRRSVYDGTYCDPSGLSVALTKMAGHPRPARGSWERFQFINDMAARGMLSHITLGNDHDENG